MKTIQLFIRLLTLAALTIAPQCAQATPDWSQPAPTGMVYIIPIHDVIDTALIYVIRRGLNEAEDGGAEAIIFDIDTPGGRVDAAEEILNMLRGVKTPTYTLVNPNAISAGAIIAMATDHIYMTPGSKIGDAMPIMLGLTGEVQPMPESVEEKSVSYVAAMIRAAAQHRGHDPQLAEAMVRRDSEYKIGDEVISKKGRLLTLTNKDAERLVGPEKRPLLSAGTVENLAALLKKIGKENCAPIELKVTSAEEIARFIESISIVLLGLGLLGLYIEFKTPGFGLPGISGIFLLAIWFWGSHIAGLAGMEEVALFLLGVILLCVELFVFPGVILPGIIGLGLIIASILMGMTQHYPGDPWYPTLPAITTSALRLTPSLLITLAGAVLAATFLPKAPLFNKLILNATITPQTGDSRSAQSKSVRIGQQGIAETRLNPAGAARFGDLRLNVVSRGDFLEPGDKIVIAETRGNRIIVDHLKNV
ncbi:MAG: NfeD family protein [bacterium]|jgi:membrane-bound serine protease (ClpP class)